jgi:hypothetical protein
LILRVDLSPYSFGELDAAAKNVSVSKTDDFTRHPGLPPNETVHEHSSDMAQKQLPTTFGQAKLLGSQ